jgi:NAD(P)H-dependent FMN reductase
MTEPFRILLVSGSTRSGSSNTALLRTAEAVAPAGIVPKLYAGMTALPHFNPDDDRSEGGADGGASLPAPVAALRSEIANARAILFSTPEYAGALPGCFKNLLDWTVGGSEMYRKPVGWVNGSAFPDGAKHAHASLATVLGYLNADIVEAAVQRIPVARGAVGDDGLIADMAIRERIADVLLRLSRARG